MSFCSRQASNSGLEGGLSGRMSSGSWMMPHPSSQYHARLAMARVNHGLEGVISQSAKTARGSRPGVSDAGVPSGKTADWQTRFVESWSKKTISSFHSDVYL